jgi:hypothetical protein
MQPKIKISRRRKHRYAVPISGIFVVLAIMGIIAVIWGSMNLTMRVLDNSSEKAQLEDFIRPIVMYNPTPFETPADIPADQLLLYSMWGTLTDEKAKSYVYSDTQELMVPASDLNVAAFSLFGDSITLEHQTFGDILTRYTYDEDTGIYYVPTHAELYVYSPEVQTIEREGELYRLTVGYLPPGNAWTTDFAGNRQSAAAEKVMYYYLSRQRDGYHIVSVRDIPNDAVVELADSAAPSETPEKE